MDSEHHRPDEFTRKKVPDNELQIYTWYGHDCPPVFTNVMARADAPGRTSQFLLYKCMRVSVRVRTATVCTQHNLLIQCALAVSIQCTFCNSQIYI